MIWVGRNGGRWRSLPAEYGKWGSVHKRFKRWADKGVWQMVFNKLVEDADMEWVMIDATIIRAHQHASGAKKGSKTTHEDALVAAFLPRSMRRVMRSATLFDSF